ncbi:MAG: type II toxin-antitoxin system VapC family toxin [Myxococcales bacterium]
MSEVALDASALLAFLRKEPGQQVVRKHLAQSIISTVNIAEVLGKAIERKIGLDVAIAKIRALPITIVPFDFQQAAICGTMREPTRHLGLSLGDRSCLALGLARKIPVLTTDEEWLKADLGVEVRLIR